MTFWYRLLGMPGNEQEFIDKVRNSHISWLNIALELEGEQFYPILEAPGLNSLRLKDFPGQQTVERNLEKSAQEQSFDDILELAYYFQNMGLNVNIGGKPVEDARRMIEKYYSARRSPTS